MVDITLEDSILNSTKKVLGVEPDYKIFDNDILTFINLAFFNLTQLGVGPVDGYAITSEENVWSEFIGVTKRIESVKTYVALKVRLLFDPPSTSAVLESINRSISELEWRLNLQSEGAFNSEVTP